jgi:2',3'-cyclic-nucleotide 2'-phosphodiesterase (5'-nucleotidase family)
VLFVHSGDALSRGGPITSYYGGRADFRALQEAGLDLFVPGNGDFYFGVPNLMAQARAVRFPFLHANIMADTPDGHVPLFAPYVIERLAGFRIAILAVGVVRMAHPSAQGLVLEDPIEVARTWVPKLRAQADLLVAVTHIGLDADLLLASEVPGIDVIVGGHSHSKLDRPERVGQAWIVQTGELGQFLGRLDVRLERDSGACRIVRVSGRLLPVDGSVPEAPDIRDLLADYQRPLDRVRFTVEAGLPAPDTGPSAMLDFMAQAMLSATGAQVALADRGAAAAGIRAGPGTWADACLVHPWRNRVLVAKLLGAQLQRVLAELDASVAGCERVPSGAGYTIGGRPIAPDEVYSVAFPDHARAETEVLWDAPYSDSGERLDLLLGRALAGGHRRQPRPDGGRISRRPLPAHPARAA